jgi:hypothetical protein
VECGDGGERYPHRHAGEWLRYRGEETKVARSRAARDEHSPLTTELLREAVRRATSTVRVRKHEARKRANLRAREEDQDQPRESMVGSLRVVALREAPDPSIRGGFRDRIRAAREQIDHATAEIRDAYVEMIACEASLWNGPQSELAWVVSSVEIGVEQARRDSGLSLARHPRCFLVPGDGTLPIATLDPEAGQPIVTFDRQRESPA